MRLALPTRLWLDDERELAKNCQGNIPAKTMIAYGAAPSVGNPGNTPKNHGHDRPFVRKGSISAQAAPATVCLLTRRHIPPSENGEEFTVTPEIKPVMLLRPARFKPDVEVRLVGGLLVQWLLVLGYRLLGYWLLVIGY